MGIEATAFAHFPVCFALAAVCGLGVQLVPLLLSDLHRLLLYGCRNHRIHTHTVVRVINNCSAGHVRVTLYNVAVVCRDVGATI